MSERKPSVFISYSQKDEDWKDELVRQLQIPAEHHGFEVWHDGQVQVGDDWRERIGTALESTQIAVLLISDEFLNSEFISTRAVPLLRDLRKQGRVEIVPVLVGACLWQSMGWLEHLELHPKGGEPLQSLSIPAQKKALVQIAEEIGAKLAAGKAPAPASEVARVEPRSVVVSGPPTLWPAGVTPRTFEFEVVAVDERGKVVERRPATNDGYVEDLGDGVTLEMMAIPGGTFLMGSPHDEAGRYGEEGPRHSVNVPLFFMGRFAVTQAQWRAVARQPAVKGRLDESPSMFKGDAHPVEQVSWDDAAEFCARLSQRTGRAYRLPSEAEWERAARADTDTPFHFGPTITPALVNHDGTYPYGKATKGQYRRQTTAAGALGTANTFGLFDVHGNVWEWTLDAWHADYDGAPTDGSAWEIGGDPSLRVVRGGSWCFLARYCRSASRHRGASDDRGNYVGFRVLCTVARTR